MTYANPEALVSTDWLTEHLDDPAVRVIEVDEDISLFGEGHIPGATAWSWTDDLHHSVRRDYIDKEGVSSLLEAAGVPEGSTVVLYGGNDNWFAAYAYWLLKYRGFDAVKILDGGRKKWELCDLPLTSAVQNGGKPSTFQIDGRDRPELRAFRDEVLRNDPETTALVDVRSPEEFSGEKLAPDHLPHEQPCVGGHVPGAKNIPWSKATREDGTFKSADDLRELYGDVIGASTVVAYCRIGERSSHTWFVLSELLGHTNAKNYDGSWTEYGSLVNVPVERGS